ncbi:MAG: DUF1489 domain-containing protein [Rhodospirillales bacterium]|nr:DUF1489 domain-containing protein [Rhodospirillales bacterium]
MALHLIKLCVGIDDLEELEALRAKRRKTEKRLFVHTRNTPKRREELLDGGSLFWVIRSQIRARQRILGITSDVDEEGRPHCLIELDWKVIPTEVVPWKPFQGWRYLEAKDAPPDRFFGLAEDDDLPPAMARELRELGLI